MKSAGRILIPASPGEIYAVLNDPTWLSSDSSDRAELISDQELTDGTRVAEVRRRSVDGALTTSQVVYLERAEDERVRLQTTGGPLIRTPGARRGLGRFELSSSFVLEKRLEGTWVHREDRIRFRPALLHPLFSVPMRTAGGNASQTACERLLARFS